MRVVLEKQGAEHTYWLAANLVWKRATDSYGADYLDFDRHKTPDDAIDYIRILIRRHLKGGWKVVEAHDVDPYDC